MTTYRSLSGVEQIELQEQLAAMTEDYNTIVHQYRTLADAIHVAGVDAKIINKFDIWGITELSHLLNIVSELKYFKLSKEQK